MNHQQELAHASRLSIMGQMATELAHELNQPLHAILANAEGSLRAAKSKSLEKNKLTERIENVIKQADRAGKIMSRIRAFAAKGMPERKEVQLNEVVSDAMEFMNAELKRCNIKAAIQLQENTPLVNADHIQIEQVIINLIQNSIDSMNNSEGGNRILTIKTQIVADSLEVSIRDTGCGIDIENQTDIFDPFVTSKEQGLGIGLSISRSIIDTHGGTLSFRDNNKEGVTLFFTIPAIL
jgi:C4-dicarboxylate-specific signal transduction histidine kinase